MAIKSAKILFFVSSLSPYESDDALKRRKLAHKKLLVEIWLFILLLYIIFSSSNSIFCLCQDTWFIKEVFLVYSV